METDPTVFIVDDDSFMRETLEHTFLRAGIPVTSFGSAVELLALPHLPVRCLLLLDVRMPGLSGIELHTILRERGVHAPVIFLTGSADVPTAVAAMRNGAADFLEKPFQSSELVARVRQAYRRHEVPVIPTAVTTMSELVNSLTPREREVLDLLITGATSKLMAKSLGGSFRTIETHRGRVMAKMGANCLAELVRMCMDLPPLKRASAKRP